MLTGRGVSLQKKTTHQQTLIPTTERRISIATIVSLRITRRRQPLTHVESRWTTLNNNILTEHIVMRYVCSVFVGVAPFLLTTCDVIMLRQVLVTVFVWYSWATSVSRNAQTCTHFFRFEASPPVCWNEMYQREVGRQIYIKHVYKRTLKLLHLVIAWCYFTRILAMLPTKVAASWW